MVKAKPKSSAPCAVTVADAHALADRMEREAIRADTGRPPIADKAMAAMIIRALLLGRAAGDVIVLED